METVIPLLRDQFFLECFHVYLYVKANTSARTIYEQKYEQVAMKSCWIMQVTIEIETIYW